MFSADFNPRTREGCDALLHGRHGQAGDISIHAPVKGATPGPSRTWRPSRYFNPRTREGCDSSWWPYFNPRTRISIHAPVKGATRQRHNFNPRTRISIHAPVKGATRAGGPYRHRPGYFNPRTREGCDYILAAAHVAGATISIHAPVKGATTPRACSAGLASNFNPRTREGCDRRTFFMGLRTRIFQSTHP